MGRNKHKFYYISGFTVSNAKRICQFFFGDFFVGLDKDQRNREWNIRLRKKIRVTSGLPITIPLKFAYDAIDSSIERNKDNEIIKICLIQLKQDFIRKYGEDAVKKEISLSEFLDVEYFKEFFGPQWVLAYDSVEKV